MAQTTAPIDAELGATSASGPATLLRKGAGEWLFLAPALAFFIGYQLWPIVRVLWLSFTDFQFLSSKPAQWVWFDRLHPGASRSAHVDEPVAGGVVHDHVSSGNDHPAAVARHPDRARQQSATCRPLPGDPAHSGRDTSTLMFRCWRKSDVQLPKWSDQSFARRCFRTVHLAGARLQWLGRTPLTLPSIAVKEVWWGLGYHTIFFIAGLAAIPAEMSDAARVDGANEWQVFWHVTRPRGSLRS